MMSSEDEAKEKDTIEKESENQETVDETAKTATTEESKNRPEPSSKKKKKKKRESSAAANSETQKAEGDNQKDEKTNGKNDTNANETTTIGEQDTQNNVRAEGGTEEESNGSNSNSNNASPKDLSSGPVVSVTKRTRPPYKYDPDKVTLRFLFANKDGLTVTVECKPTDTIGEVKGQLLSVWPEDLQSCTSGDQLRLICMGKGMLTPDSRTLNDCEVPVFKTHPTPVNVALRPKANLLDTSKSGKDGNNSRGASSSGGSNSRVTEQSGQGCGCVIS